MIRHFARSLILFAALILVVTSCTLPTIVTPTPTPTPTAMVASTDLYVSTRGNDANDCLSLASACLSVQRAIDVSSEGDTIHIGAGSFGDARPWSPRHSLHFVGEGVDRTTLLATDTKGFRLGHAGDYSIQDMSIVGNNTDTNFYDGIQATGALTLTLTNCRISRTHNGLYTFPGVVTTIIAPLMAME